MDLADYHEVDPDSDGESPQGMWFYNQGRSCYTIELNEDDEFCYSQQMASGNVLRGVLGAPPLAPGDPAAQATTPGTESTPPAQGAEPPWTWEALLSNQARIRLRRDGPRMVSSYNRSTSDGWTVPQCAGRRFKLTAAEHVAERASRSRQLLRGAHIECGGAGRPLGLCKQCSCCAGWTATEQTSRWRDLFAAAAELAESERSQEVREARGRELHSLCDPVPEFDGVSFNFPRVAWDTQGHRTESKLPCGRCGCPEHMHEDVTRKFGRFLSQRGHLLRTNIPLAALRWTQLELALWGDTKGIFMPKVPVVARKSKHVPEVKVSVICPTTSSRRCFHPFLWSCFNSQTVAKSELIIVDTCQDGPSPFFEEKARVDKRVTYKYYHVPPWQWSIGVKRNLACYYASGKAIAHFDDDDLYAPIYLEEMLRCLQDPKLAFSLPGRAQLGQNMFLNMLAGLGFSKDFARLPPSTEVGPTGSRQTLDEETLSSALGDHGAGLAKLSSWHMFSIKKQAWGFFDAVGGDDEPLQDVSNSLYGWGFSMVYLRTVWEMCPFLHMNLGEDFDFAKSIRNLNFPVVLIPDRRGICSHTHHSDNTAGGQEFFDYGNTSALLYSPMGGMITGYTCAVKALQSFQEQQMEEGKSRRDVDGKLRDVSSASMADASPDTAGAAEPAPAASGATPPAEAARAGEEARAQEPRARLKAPAAKRPEPRPVQEAPPCRFSIVSSVDGFRSKEDMVWDGSSFRYVGTLATVGERIQLLKNGQREAAVFPSVNDADLSTAHVLRGPGRGSGCYWRLAPRGRRKDGGTCEVVLSCPMGWPLSLSWSCGEDVDGREAGGAAAPGLVPGTVVGDWKLLWELEGQQAGAAFFLAEAKDGQRVTVKHPTTLRELQHLEAMRGVLGVPPLLGCGSTTGGGLFLAAPALGDSLERVLARCNHDGQGGRIPWAAAQHLGRMLLTTLRGLHARGLVLGGISLRGIRIEAEGAQAYLMDIGQSRPFWAEASGELGLGGGDCEFDSIRAGFSDDRSPVDDLESLGWLLWRCAVGPLPWCRLAAVLGSKTGDERRRLRERVAKAKREVFRAGYSAFGQRYNYCPADLDSFLRCVRGINDLGGLKASKYSELERLFEAPDSHLAWAEAVSGCPRACHRAAAGWVLWRAAGDSFSLDSELVAGSGAFSLATTNRAEVAGGGRWKEVERIWAPGLPQQLLEQRGWVLVADWAGPVLEQLLVPDEAVAGDDGGGSVLSEADLLIPVLGPLARVRGSHAADSDKSHREAARSEADSDEEVDQREREREVMEVAATVARQYVKATAFQQ